MRKALRITAIYISLCLLPHAGAEDHAPYLALAYLTQDQPFDILVSEVRPTISTRGTYFNALGWTGGYTGLQMTDRGPGFIFSIWDPPGTESSPSIRSLYSAPGSRVERFGGEGTGLHYMNTAATWTLNHWYRFVVRAWDDGDRTCFALWTQDEETGIWTHHVTMSAPETHVRFNGWLSSFLEDYAGTGNNIRRDEYRGIRTHSSSSNWKPASNWYPTSRWNLINTAYFTVSKDNTGPSRYIKAYDAGVRSNTFFLQSGGDTKPAISSPRLLLLPTRLSGDDAATPKPWFPLLHQPQPSTEPDVPSLTITRTHAVIDHATVHVDWTSSPSAAPQFSYQVQLFSTLDGQHSSIGEQQHIAPNQQDATLTLPTEAKLPISVTLILTDIFDHTATVTVPVSR